MAEIRKRERRQNATPPFTTSKLQQEAAHRLGFSSKKTMMVIAQKLYEGIPVMGEGLQGFDHLYENGFRAYRAHSAFSELREYIKHESMGMIILPSQPIIYTRSKGKTKVQDAHEAIRPTNLKFSPQQIKPRI